MSKRKKTKKHQKSSKEGPVYFFIIGLVLVAVLLIVSYIKPGRDEPGFTKEGTLEFIRSQADDSWAVLSEIDIEIAEDFQSREQGLMHRRSMKNDRGMLFIFDSQTAQSFWMRNTYISLDILFVNQQARIVHIAEKTTPLSDDQIPSSSPAQYVVEVNAGYCSRHNIKVGDYIRMNRK